MNDVPCVATRLHLHDLKHSDLRILWFEREAGRGFPGAGAKSYEARSSLSRPASRRSWNCDRWRRRRLAGLCEARFDSLEAAHAVFATEAFVRLLVEDRKKSIGERQRRAVEEQTRAAPPVGS
jgi:hypothetical protein